jgi:hypothetical protein
VSSSVGSEGGVREMESEGKRGEVRLVDSLL